MTKRVYNFSAGPAVLPLPVLEQAQRELLALPGVGMSVMEISHRSKTFETILAETKSLLVELLGIPAGYSLIFLQGGSSLQFSMLPMNFLRGGRTADYVVSGSWSSKACDEARREGTVNVAWDGKSEDYKRLPKADELKLTSGATYLHVCSNETIHGVQFPETPSFGSAPLVCDVSSDFLSRPIPVSRHGLIYACAQKNAGIAGVTAVIVRDDLLETVSPGLPPMLDYKVFVKNDSMPNTPATFAIYMLMLVARWLKNEVGGLEKMAEHNQRKAKLVYDILDSSGGFYRGHAQADCRSLMNVTFRLTSEELEKKFLDEAKARDLYDLKGHRSVGGIRASIYNAMPLEGVQALCEFMRDFEKANRR